MSPRRRFSYRGRMLVTIAGCGSLGCLLAARLCAGGATVQVFQRAGPHLDALRRDGITIENDRGGATTVTPVARAADRVAELEPSELVIVLVKAYDTASLAPLRPLLTPDAVVLTLQNGLGNGESLAKLFGAPRIAVGTTN